MPSYGIKLKNKNIENVTQFKYLGLNIDHKLTWAPHINERIANANNLLFKLKSYIGKNWGPSPKMTIYSYTSCIRPQLAYGCFAFANRLSGNAKKKLTSFQRRVLMTTGNYRENTPGSSLEVIFDIAPIDLFMKYEARKANYRLKPNFDHDWCGTGKSKRMGHVFQASLDELEMGLPKEDSDRINCCPIWEKEYEVIPSNGDDDYKRLRCYTDGSKTKHGVGSGVCIMERNWVYKSRAFGINNYCTVFQAEVYAIKQACGLIKQTIENEPDLTTQNTIRILSDSQAALQALDRIDTDSKLVRDTKLALNTLGKSIKIELAWVKAHVNYKGNELADRLAKTGTKLQSRSNIGPSRAHINAKINEEMYKEWNQRWMSLPGHRQTKALLPSVYDRGKAKQARSLTRADLGIYVRNITGHCFMARHNNIVGNSNPTQTNATQNSLLDLDGSEDEPSAILRRQAECRKCQLTNTEETPLHLIFECEAIWYERWESFGTPLLNDRIKWKPQSFVAFFKKMKLEN